jgi:O-methyltransferase domain/Dimerisation domain
MLAVLNAGDNYRTMPTLPQPHSRLSHPTDPIDPSESGRRADPAQGFSPAGQLLNLISGYWVTQAIYAAAELGLADLLGRKGRTVTELAHQTQTNEDALYRLLRALASVGIFAEVAPREFAITPMAVLLRDDTPGNLRAFSRFQGDAWHWGCWGDIVNSVRSGQPATVRLYQAAHCFDYLTGNRESATIFDAAMSGYASQMHAAILDAYDFRGARLIVDVGGGQGRLLATILADSPQASGIVFDQAAVTAQVPAVLAEFGVGERCAVQSGDFFATIPANGDLYLLSSVLHDWNDEQAASILRGIAAAMSKHARVLIVENVIAPGNDAQPGKFIDLEMLLVAGGRERTKDEFAALLTNAGLRLERVVETAVSAAIVVASAH